MRVSLVCQPLVFNNKTSGPAVSRLGRPNLNVSDTPHTRVNQMSLLQNPIVRRTVHKYTPESKFQIRDAFEDIRDEIRIIEDGF